MVPPASALTGTLDEADATTFEEGQLTLPSSTMTPRWTCPSCTGVLTKTSSTQVADSDAISMDAVVTTWRCPECKTERTHWLMPRAGMVDGRVVDASRERWSPSAPSLVFVAPWHAIDDSSKYEAELAREVSEGHPLFKKALRAIARHEACDDVVFAGDDAVYVVHLTWIGHRESDPRWPTTSSFRSLADFAERCMQDE